jgi:hypothetical protein
LKTGLAGHGRDSARNDGQKLSPTQRPKASHKGPTVTEDDEKSVIMSFMCGAYYFINIDENEEGGEPRKIA